MATISVGKSLEKLQSFALSMQEHARYCCGYPVNLDFNLGEFFAWWVEAGLCNLHLNDAGRPEGNAPYQLNTHKFEREVLAYFANLYHFPSDNFWGYLTSGSSQGVEQGLLMGRNFLRHYGEPVAYFSEEAHYSVKSVISMLDLPWKMINCLPSGQMDLANLADQLVPGRPALVNITIGTTFKGAIDNRKAIGEFFATCGLPAHYVHLDAALFGGYLPYLKGEGVPQIFFDEIPYDSISVSGHKFFGAPVPIGIFLMQKEHTKNIPTDYVEYLESDNLIIPCSRSSLNTLILWWTINTKKLHDWQEEAKRLMENALYLEKLLSAARYPCWRNSFSNIVYFPCPNKAICLKWSLPVTNDKNLGRIAHLIVMQHVSKALLEEFVEDIS